MKGYLKIITAAIIWGSVGIIVRIVDMPVPMLALYRVFFASISIYFYIVLTRKTAVLKVGKNIYRLIVMGTLLSINWVSFFYAVKLTSVANAVLLTYTAPILIAILAPIFLKERLERITILTLALSLLGAVLISWPSINGFGSKDADGFLCAGLSAITYAMLVILAKPITARVNVMAIIFYEEVTCTVLLSPALIIYNNRHINSTTLITLFMLGAVHTALAAGLYLSGLRDVKAQHAGIFTYLDPFSAVVLAAVFLGEIPGMTTLAGGIIIIASGLLLVLVKRERVETEIVGE